MKLFAPILALLVAALLAGCGGANDDAAGGDGVSISYALEHEGDELLVNGNLLVQGDEVRLCSALAESFPPQCGGASLDVQGLELGQVGGLVTEGEVGWTDGPIQLGGIVEDGALTVSDNARR